MACTATLHVALLILSLLFLSGGSGGMGTGSGSDYGDGSGGNGLAVAGYVTLNGNSENGNSNGLDSGVSEQHEMVQEFSSVEDNANDSIPSDEIAELADIKQPVEPIAEAIPFPSPLVPSNPPEKKQQTIERPVVANRERQKTKAPPSHPNKKNRINEPLAKTAPDAHASSAENGNGTGDRDGDRAGQGTGGSATDSSRGGGSGAPGFGYALNMVDKKPQVLRRGPVPYPESARRNGLMGNVVLRFLLNEKGEISYLQVIHADPPEVFNYSALTAIQKWKFSPAIKDGKAVPAWVELPLHFSLR